MSDTVLFRKVRIAPHHAATGKTRHFSHGDELGLPAELQIVAYAGDPGFYLLYCDSEGKAMTDTYHQSISSALDQAEWEFGVSPSEWQTVSEP